MILNHFHLALLDAEVRESMAYYCAGANRVPLQTLLEEGLFLWFGERTAMDLGLLGGLGHWEVMSSPSQGIKLARVTK